MALSFSKWQLTVSLKDQGGNISVLRYHMVDAAYADADAAATVLLGYLAAVTDSLIVRAALAQIKVEDSATFGSGENENVALVIAQINPTKTTNLQIPCPKAGLFKGISGDNWNTLDTSDTDLQNYLSCFDSSTDIAYTSDGEQLAPITSQTFEGKRIHRGSRKG